MASTRIELTTLKDALNSWAKGKDLKHPTFAKRDIDSAKYSYGGNKNDCRIFSKGCDKDEKVDARPHFSVWLYCHYATVIFCANTTNEVIISKLDHFCTNGKLSVKEYDEDKRKHYKIPGQKDEDLSQITSADDEKSNSASVVKSVCAQLDALYNIVGSYL